MYIVLKYRYSLKSLFFLDKFTLSNKKIPEYGRWVVHIIV